MDRDKIEIVSHVLMAIALFAILQIGLLGALLPGLLIYSLVQVLSPAFIRLGFTHAAGRAMAMVIPIALVIVAVSFGVVELISLFRGPESIQVLLQRMAEIVETSRQYLPAWAAQYVPTDFAEFQAAGGQWLRENAGRLGVFGQDAGRVLFHVILGMIVGALVAFNAGKEGHSGPLALAMEQRATTLNGAFRNIVFSQVRISAINTVATAIYLAVILPLLDIHLPLLKTMIAVTFIAGLLPVLGNLISNTVIVIVSFSVSPVIAIGSLIFLVVIHKLEYFLNARIIGSRINARAWELLIALLVMEAVFGIPGLIAAPIYYAYMKDELTNRGLI